MKLFKRSQVPDAERNAGGYADTGLGRVQWFAHSAAHRFLHERADPYLVGGCQLRQSEGGRLQAPSSRFAVSLKPSVAYLVLNFCALWKKQTTLPSWPHGTASAPCTGNGGSMVWRRHSHLRRRPPT
jgi:hypothetical protein